MRRPLDTGPIAARCNFFSILATPMTDGVVLAFDYGARRTGVAIANTVTRSARPLTTIDASINEARWDAIRALVDEWQPTEFVVGIPCHPDGAPHELTARCERFARQLEGRYGRPVARVDERYSSAISSGAADIDAEAAAVILQQWLEEGERNA
jgi:putative holliday junction resolvase